MISNGGMARRHGFVEGRDARRVEHDADVARVPGIGDRRELLVEARRRGRRRGGRLRRDGVDDVRRRALQRPQRRQMGSHVLEAEGAASVRGLDALRQGRIVV